MKHFDQLAEYYDDVLPPHVEEHYFYKRLHFLTKLLKEGLVLDVCSGTGRISEGLINEGFQVVSLDLSMNMLLRRMKVKGYWPVNGLSYELPFRSNTFDMVISVASMHHIADKEKVRSTIQEMQRVTKAGGFIVIWDHNPLNPYWKLLMKKVPQDIGEERLIGADELLSPFAKDQYALRVYKKGFVPDFAPRKLMKLFRVIEALLESLPVLKLLAAHNVIVARKKQE